MRWKAVLGLITWIGLMRSPNVTATHPLSNIYQLAFQVYRKAFTLAYTRELTSDQREELERISEEQPSIGNIHKSFVQKMAILSNIKTNIDFLI